MKSKKIISFLLMLTMLFTMNIVPGFAVDDTHSLTITHNSGGTVTTDPNQTVFSRTVICGETEHDHEDGNCDLTVLSCSNLHTHDENCREKCSQEDHPEHDDSCYAKNQLICKLDIHEHELFKCTRVTCGEEAHVHTPDCIGLTCKEEEHVHGLSCFNWKLQLVCGKKLHVHDEIINNCYGKVCGKHTHVHGIGCHTFGDCGLPEHKSHTDDCYGDVLTCTKELHAHSEQTCQRLICEKPEHTEDDHNVESGCYICSLDPHTHTDDCYTWPEVTVTIMPDSENGYYIKSIKINGDDTEENPILLTMDQNHSVDVVFDREITPPPSSSYTQTVSYSLNVEIEGPGSVSPSRGSYSRGSTVTLSPTPDEGAQFVGWFGANGADVSDTNRIVMNGSKSVIARFELIAPPVEEEIIEIIDETVPESGGAAEEDEIVLDEPVPQDGDILPQTSGIPIELVIGAGFALVTSGISLRKKEEKEKK